MQSNTPNDSPVSDDPVAASRRQPIGQRSPDAGSPKAALIAIIATVVLFLTVTVWQQMSVQKLADAKPDPAASSETSIFTLYAKAFTKGFGALFEDQDRSAQAVAMKPVVSEINKMAYTPTEKLQAAICTAELAGAETAVAAIEDASKWLDEQVRENDADPKKGIELAPEVREAFNENRDLLLRHYRSKLEANSQNSAPPQPLTEAEAATLKDRLGWFGRLAIIYGDFTAPDREKLLAGGTGIVILTFVIGSGIVFAALAAVVLFIVAIVFLISGRITSKFVPPAPGGSVYLETVAMFILGFVILKVVVTLLAMAFIPAGEKHAPEWIGGVQLGLQWLLALIPLYPLLRGVSFPQWRQEIGFVAPKGVAREIGVGILAYFTGLPIFFVGVIITLVLKLLWEAIKSTWGGEATGPATNPIFEEILSSNPLNLILLVALATIWAPFVEEMVFRGALYRHLRSRSGLLIAALVSAVVFGGMHGYELVLLGPVISLGIVFALMREWRGSIIPSITAHMMHNGTVLAMAIIMIKLISM